MRDPSSAPAPRGAAGARPWRPWVISALGALAATVGAATAWWTLERPFLVISGCGVLAAALAAWQLRAPRLRVVTVNAAVIGVLIGGAEAVSMVREGGGFWRPQGLSQRDAPELLKAELVAAGWKAHPEGLFTRPEFVTRPDPTYGWALLENAKVEERRYDAKGGLLYDVVYNTTADGRRITPPAVAGARAVLFYGCSMTFGLGVQDAESFPYRFGEREAGRYVAYNFGLPGAGPHHALAALENGREQAVVGEPVALGVFLLARYHAERVGGDVFWGEGAPRYRLEAGRVVRDGSFETAPSRPGATKPETESDVARAVSWTEWARRSALLGGVLDRWRRTAWVAEPPRPYEDLLAAIVVRLRDVFVERYHAPFVVIIWPDYDIREVWLVRRLQEAGVTLVEARDAMPGSANEYLIVNDWHPSPRGHQVLADLVERYVDSLPQSP